MINLHVLVQSLHQIQFREVGVACETAPVVANCGIQYDESEVINSRKGGFQHT